MADQDVRMPFMSSANSATHQGDIARGYSTRLPDRDLSYFGRVRSRSMERPARPGPQRPGPSAAAKSRLPTTAPLMTKLKTGRQTNKAVSLPLEGHAQAPVEGSTDLVEDIRRTILALSIADGFNLKDTMPVLRSAFPRADLHLISECLHFSIRSTDGDHSEEVYIFDYGTLIFWGCGEEHRSRVLQTLNNQECQIIPLGPSEVERDTFSVIYAPVEKSVIENDTITIPQIYSTDWRIKMAISHALAQSTKLLLYEQRLGDLVNRTKDMPAYLAKTGKVSRTRKQIAQLIGTVFIHKSNVNLLSSVLDTPEYFWAAPDIHQRIYKRVTEYLELDQRITVLNNRFEVITELLNIIREHDNHLHMTRLEWIVIWLIVVEVVVGLLECASILGFVKAQQLVF
eukprot:jgi/Ulvmu1/8967/UM005_0058.1